LIGLLELQQRVTRGITGGNLDDVLPWIVGPGSAAIDCLGILQNTWAVVLTQALTVAFPAVRKLVGSQFFDRLARDFLNENAPSDAWLDLYGADLPVFISTYEPARSVPYLADVARLEVLVNRAIHAPRDPHLSVATLGESLEGLGDIRFVSHPSLGLLESHFAVDVIWRAVLNLDGQSFDDVDPEDVDAHLLVARNGGGVRVERLTQEAHLFAELLAEGFPLAQAAAHVPVDCAEFLAHHFTEGHFTTAVISTDFSGKAQ
jgi:hypothetical protein